MGMPKGRTRWWQNKGEECVEKTTASCGLVPHSLGRKSFIKQSNELSSYVQVLKDRERRVTFIIVGSYFIYGAA